MAAVKNGSAELQGMINTLRAIPQLAKNAAPDVADVVRDELKKTADAGTTPFGQPWLARQHDGGRAMLHAADAVKVGAVGSTIVCVLKGPEARHHAGTAKGGIRRQVLPISGKIPPQIDKAVRDVLSEAFEDLARNPR